MTTKIITLDPNFYTGEPTVQLVSTWGRDGRVLREATSLHKVASTKSPALDYIKNVTPEPGKSIVLVVGLGDHETYGPNRNGDGFPSEPIPGKIEPDQVLTKHYQSYKNAHVFRHHVNSDPAKAIGRVKQAFWNPAMRRVEVLEDFEHSKAPDLLEKIANREAVAKSMGCRIKYDTCSICGNKARTRNEYCDHLKYEMGRIDPNTGKQAAALNPSPDFFDSSWVIRPADRTGFMLKKVAYSQPYEINSSSFELGEQVDALKEKSAEIGKAADIEKVLVGEPEAIKSHLTEKDIKLLSKYRDQILPGKKKNAKPVKIQAIRIMAQFSPGDTLETTESLGLPLCLSELLQFFMARAGQPEELPEEVKKSASAHVPAILNVFETYPAFYQALIKECQLENGQFNQKLADAAMPFVGTGDYLSSRMLPNAYKQQEPLTNTYTWTDPQTGHQYQTNQYAIQQTRDQLAPAAYANKALKAGPLLGLSALLGTAAMRYKHQGFPARGKMIGSLLGSAATGAYGMHQALKPTQLPGPTVMTDQGKPISGWTEMVRVAADDAPEVRYMVRRSLDLTTPLSKTAAERLQATIKTAVDTSSSTELLGDTLDLEKVATALGNSIVAYAKNLR